MKSKDILSLMLVISLISCGSCKNQKPKASMTQEEIDEQLIHVNKQLIKDDKILINHFVREKGWEMKESGTGLRYWIYEEGQDSTQAEDGMTAEVQYEVTLLDGTLCSMTKENEAKRFVIGHADIESGIHEAILFMSPGDKAKVILPPHLAHGLTGDMVKIPLHSTLVYDITLVSLR
jgi:FKBP-type peptidyl-prolyl cis-trans isomerase FkpA